MSAKVFILVYTDTLGTREEIQKFLDSRQEILSWRAELPNCFYLISESDTPYLSGLIRGFDRGNASFLVMEMHTNRQGWLDPESWKFFRGDYKKKFDVDDVPF